MLFPNASSDLFWCYRDMHGGFSLSADFENRKIAKMSSGSEAVQVWRPNIWAQTGFLSRGIHVKLVQGLSLAVCGFSGNAGIYRVDTSCMRPRAPY